MRGRHEFDEVYAELERPSGEMSECRQLAAPCNRSAADWLDGCRAIGRENQIAIDCHYANVSSACNSAARLQASLPGWAAGGSLRLTAARACAAQPG